MQIETRLKFVQMQLAHLAGLRTSFDRLTAALFTVVVEQRQ